MCLQVRELFVMAREHAPSIIFMDEVDSIGSARSESGGGGGGDSEVQRTMLELLNQLDGFEASNKIKVCPQLASRTVMQVFEALLRLRLARLPAHVGQMRCAASSVRAQ